MASTTEEGAPGTGRDGFAWFHDRVAEIFEDNPLPPQPRREEFATGLLLHYDRDLRDQQFVAELDAWKDASREVMARRDELIGEALTQVDSHPQPDAMAPRRDSPSVAEPQHDRRWQDSTAVLGEVARVVRLAKDGQDPAGLVEQLRSVLHPAAPDREPSLVRELLEEREQAVAPAPGLGHDPGRDRPDPLAR